MSRLIIFAPLCSSVHTYKFFFVFCLLDIFFGKIIIDLVWKHCLATIFFLAFLLTHKNNQCFALSFKGILKHVSQI